MRLARHWLLQVLSCNSQFRLTTGHLRKGVPFFRFLSYGKNPGRQGKTIFAFKRKYGKILWIMKFWKWTGSVIPFSDITN